MRIAGLAALLLISLVVESTLLEGLKIWGAKPDLILVWVILLSLVWGPRRGAALGFVFGLVEDLFFAKYIGINALIKMSVGFIIGLGENKLVKENIIVPITAALTGGIVFWFFTFFLDLYLGRALKVDFSIILANLLYNCFIALLGFKWVYKSSQNGLLKLTEQWRDFNG